MRRPRFTTSRFAALALAPLLAVLAAPLPAAAQQAVPYYFWITSTRSVKCLTVADASTADGAPLTQQGCDEAAYNQYWTFIHVEGDYYLLAVRHSAKCLTIANAGVADWTLAVQQPCDRDDTSQQWSFPPVGGNNNLAMARHSAKCLTEYGVAVVQRTCNGRTNQQWRLGF
ncbi:RICIN domain-containing protein [Actinoplanes sp. NPDC026623]|uniref:RICIN domain-containing protein n=1 Tax=Actinoplanes sp. NPDC026623 TaxID=3155610 RepID=UPI00340D20EC